jgi:hypothetical protein
MVGDIVYIRYWLTGDITPVKIVEKPSKNVFIVSHKVEKSQLFNAPNHSIKKGEILGLEKSVGEPVNSTERYVENPNIRPDTSGIIPGWNSWNNDIAF